MGNINRNKLECDIVCDLLPLYHDGVVSEATKTAVEQHISECDKCRDELKSLQEELPGETPSAPVTRRSFANMMRNQKRRRILWTGISVILAIALLIGAYFGQLQLPIFDVPEEEITVHRVYRYETEDGYHFFLLYSAPHYDYMHLGTDIEDDGATLVLNLQKPFISKKHEDVGKSGCVEVYSCGWSSSDDGGREFSTFEQIKFSEKVVWTADNADDPIPEYVYAHEEMYSGSGEVTAWITGADEGYVGAVYSDGRTVMWNLDGDVISDAPDTLDNSQPVDREDIPSSKLGAGLPVDVNSAGVGQQYDLSAVENWFVALQVETERLIATGKLTQEQAKEIETYYEAEISKIRGYIEAGGVEVLDKTDIGLVDEFYEITEISFEPPALNEVFEWYARDSSLLGIAVNLPLNK